MAKTGRKTQPNALKLLKGSDKRYLNDAEPKPTPIAPDTPDWLPDEAKSFWAEVAPELEKLGLLTSVDGPAFAMMALHYAEAVRAAKQMKRGNTAKDEDGLVRKHPAAQILRDNSAAFRQYVAEFGLSPASRAGLRVKPLESGKGKFGDLLSK